jgi:transposase InsO family protein
VGYVSADALGAIAGADFVTTEVWTWRGLVTYDTRFVIDLATRRVQMVGGTSHPDEASMCQAGRTMTATDEGALAGCRVLIWDRDPKWSAPLRHMLEESGVRVVQTPFQAPHGNAHAERVVRSITDECLNRLVPMGERHLRRALHAFVEHCHRERHHQGLGNERINGPSSPGSDGRICRRQRLGGWLNYDCRAA